LTSSRPSYPSSSAAPPWPTLISASHPGNRTSQPGALVEGVASGSPAAAAGLRAGDLITAINGSAIHGPSALIAAIASQNPGQSLTLAVRRASSTLTITVTLATQPTTPPTAG
jgi:S1-C subfamily serine protease